MSARLTAKNYLPTALISKQLPAGLSDMRTMVFGYQYSSRNWVVCVPIFHSGVTNCSQLVRARSHDPPP
eukprot:821870-Prymnesium_polylepis.1